MFALVHVFVCPRLQGCCDLINAHLKAPPPPPTPRPAGPLPPKRAHYAARAGGARRAQRRQAHAAVHPGGARPGPRFFLRRAAARPGAGCRPAPSRKAAARGAARSLIAPVPAQAPTFRPARLSSRPYPYPSLLSPPQHLLSKLFGATLAQEVAARYLVEDHDRPGWFSFRPQWASEKVGLWRVGCTGAHARSQNACARAPTRARARARTRTNPHAHTHTYTRTHTHARKFRAHEARSPCARPSASTGDLVHSTARGLPPVAGGRGRGGAAGAARAAAECVPPAG